MTGIFKANNPSGNAILFFYALVLKIPLFLHAFPPRLQPADGILYKFLLQATGRLGESFSSIYSIITFVLLFTQAITINKIVNSQRLHKVPNYLTGMSYLLVTSLFSEWFSLSAPLVVNSFVLWIFAMLCSLYSNPDPKATIFNIGLLCGTVTFFYFPSGAFLLLIIGGITVAKPFRLREWIAGMMGVIAPLYFIAAWLFLTDKLHLLTFPVFRFSYPHFFGNQWAYAAMAIIIIVFATGIYYINSNMNRQVVQTRKSWQLLFLYIGVAALVPFINGGINFSYWILPVLPLAPVLGAAFFYPKNKIFPLLFHWGMVAIFTAVAFFNK